MSDLRAALDALREQIEALPSSATATQIGPLETEARQLLTQSKNTEFEDEARALFSQLARLSAPGRATPEASQVRSLLRRARIRIEIAGDDQDYDEAIDILAEALDLDPQNAETQELLQQAASRSSQHMLKVQGLGERYGVAFGTTDTSSDSAGLQGTITADPSQFVPSGNMPPAAHPPSSVGAPEPDAQLSEIASTYYAGDYERTIELANQLLATDLNNGQVQEYKQKSEDNLMRGVVPDHRIPFDARVAYNRANSLVRAGNYEEAERLYRQARDIAEQGGIRTWKDVEQALLEIQDLVLARELLADGDRLLAADDWNGALAKYQGALRVVAGDPEAEERVALIKQVQEQFDQANMRLSMISGTLLERADGLVDLLNMLSGLRQVLPGSRRLQQMVTDINKHIQNVRSQLIEQGHSALTRIDGVGAMEEKYRLAEEAREFFNVALQLDSTDEVALTGKRQADQLATELNDGRQLMERAAGLIAQNFDNELAQARQMLTGLRHHAQDQRYQALLGDLLARHLERVEIAIDRRDVDSATRWLAIAKDDPFRVLGRRSEILRLENDVRAIRQRRLVNYGGFGVIGLLILATIFYINRGALESEFFPSDTPSSTVTSTFTASPTASATSTPSATSTNTPTSTATSTPTATPTPLSEEDQTATTVRQIAIASETAAEAGTRTQAAIIAENNRRETLQALDMTLTQDAFDLGLTLTADARNARLTAEAATITQQATQTQVAGTQFATETQIAETADAIATRDRINTLTATNIPPTATPTRTPTRTPTASATPRLDLCLIFSPGPINPVNVREEPSVNAGIVDELESGSTAPVFEVIENNVGEVWYLLEYTSGASDIVGWVRSDVVRVVGDGECPEPE